ncbi:MAG: YeeE/YedE family protein [Bdellovibrionales bacterium]|nr:YeeE/YedE family protein [Bdellovibrionales bacterium]
MHSYWLSLLGGVFIGISASLLLLWNGRVLGVSGIVGGSLIFKKNDFLWRLIFISGLICGGFFLQLFIPQQLNINLERSWIGIGIAGLLVGFGTSLGNGCTSGHGICGISRLSARSIAATLAFMIAGVVTATLVRVLGGVV